MEWYQVVLVIAAFIGVLVGFYFLAKKGVLDAGQVSGLASIIEGIHALVDSLHLVLKDDVTKTFGVVVDLLEKAVYAAENLYYNEIITKEERKERCLAIFDELLKANQIELTPEIEGVVDNLIAAICEEMGHTPEAIEGEVEQA